jgi:hypothetical protein
MIDRRHSCKFCGGDPNEAGHWRRCDGKQGALEALPLFRESLPYTGLTTETRASSAAAAARMAADLGDGGSHAETARGRVFRFLRARGRRGATDNELTEGLRMSASTARPRRIELWRAGLIESAGYKRGDCTVWTITDAARDATAARATAAAPGGV